MNNAGGAGIPILGKDVNVEAYRAAAAQGNAAAQCILGICYYESACAKHKLEELHAAAERGDVISQCTLGC